MDPVGSPAMVSLSGDVGGIVIFTGRYHGTYQLEERLCALNEEPGQLFYNSELLQVAPC